MTTTSDDATERLNKYLAFHLGISRRQADELISQGRVSLTSSGVTTLGARINPNDTVFVDNTPVTPRTNYTYIAFHKPVGYVCSRKQQGDTPTIYSLLPPSLHHLKTVGRLDADSSGLLLLTDDGDFTQQMTHPRHYKQKHYLVTLDRDLEPLHQQMINDYGIRLEDGPSKLTLERQSDHNRTDWHVTMSEGRNRQIRRTFDALGYTVVKLHRTHFGNYSLNNIPTGQWITLDIS